MVQRYIGLRLQVRAEKPAYRHGEPQIPPLLIALVLPPQQKVLAQRQLPELLIG